MTVAAIVVIAVAAVVLVIARSRLDGWARSEREKGRESLWTRNIGTAAPRVAASRPARWGAWLGVPVGLALLIAGIAVGGNVGTGLLIVAVVVISGVYALRIRVG